MLADHTTLTRFLIEERRRHPGAVGDLNALILDVSVACKAISRLVAYGELAGALGDASSSEVRAEIRKKLDVSANQVFLQTTEWGGSLAGIISAELQAPYVIPGQHPRGKYLLVFEPLDRSSNIDINLSVGSIFSILRSPEPGTEAPVSHFLQPGSQQVCAGYAIYGPSTMLVISVGTGVHGFTLDPDVGEFILTHPAIRTPTATSEFAINASNSRFWEPAVKRYVDECLAGETGPRRKDFNMRWVESLVADTHRILLRGGVFLFPRDTKDPERSSRLRLLYEANPVGFLVEQAGGRASTGREPLLQLVPTDLNHRIDFIFGSREEVERLEQHHRDHNLREYDAPLFGERGLFRPPV